MKKKWKRRIEASLGQIREAPCAGCARLENRIVNLEITVDYLRKVPDRLKEFGGRLYAIENPPNMEAQVTPPPPNSAQDNVRFVDSYGKALD